MLLPTEIADLFSIKPHGLIRRLQAILLIVLGTQSSFRRRFPKNCTFLIIIRFES